MEKALIYQKISEVMQKVGAVEKGRKNVQQNYSFRGIDDMYNALNEHLANAKIFFTSEIIGKEREERETKAGGVLFYTVLTIKWTIFAEDGSSVNTITVGEAMDSGDKSSNKAMSAAYKYALMQIFCIPTEDAKDTENETHEVKSKAYNAPQAPRKEFVLSNDANAVRKTCVDCGREYNPRPGTEAFSTKCIDCFRKNGTKSTKVIKEELATIQVEEPPMPDQPF